MSAVLLTVVALLGPSSETAEPVEPVAHVSSCGRRCKRRKVRPYNAKLERMAWCESRKRWHLNTGNGYYGGLQFKLSTWRSVGGHRYPHRNSELEQKFRAVKLIHRRGYSPWPHCGYV